MSLPKYRDGGHRKNSLHNEHAAVCKDACFSLLRGRSHRNLASLHLRSEAWAPEMGRPLPATLQASHRTWHIFFFFESWLFSRGG